VANWENNIAANPAVSQHPARSLVSRLRLGYAWANLDQQAAFLKDKALHDSLRLQGLGA
jgi:hypothetical protein